MMKVVQRSNMAGKLGEKLLLNTDAVLRLVRPGKLQAGKTIVHLSGAGRDIEALEVDYQVAVGFFAPSDLAHLSTYDRGGRPDWPMRDVAVVLANVSTVEVLPHFAVVTFNDGSEIDVTYDKKVQDLFDRFGAPAGP